MNTAPKLPDQLLAWNVRNALGPYNDDDMPLIDLIIQLRNKLAALAPPSGEGVDAPLVQRLGMLVTMLRAEAAAGNRGYNFGEDAANHRSGRIADEIEQAIHEVRVLGKSHPQTAGEAELCRTTPQSAPVDGWKLVPLEPDERMFRAAHMAVCDYQETHSSIPDAAGYMRGIRKAIYSAMLAAAPTPPPASQERGGYYKTASGLWRMRAPTASPPSSAAEASINSPEIDSKLIPDAAEQAKPAGDDAIREQYRDGTFTRYFGAHPSEQAQAGELPPLPQEVSEVFAADKDGYDYLTAGKCYYTADQMREYANACRLAGGVTVDDEVKEYLEGAYRHIANVSGSALLAGEKHDKEDKHLLYKEACRALCFVGNAYYRLTGNNPPLEAK